MTLPDCFERWPFKRTINPAYEMVKRENDIWVHSFKGADSRFLLSAQGADPSLLVALAYPRVPADHLRILADWMTTFFIVDDLTDRLPSTSVRKLAAVIMDALRNPFQETNEDLTLTENVIGAMFRSFWSRGHHLVNPTLTRRFIEHYESYTESVCREAEDRDEYRLMDLDSYFPFRRDTIGSKPCFDLLLLSVDVTDTLLESPLMSELEELANDMIIIANDIGSYNKEQCIEADQHNVVAIAMRDKSLSVQEALDFAGELFRSRGDRFVMAMNRSRYYETLETYAKDLGNWVTANYEWTFESDRYKLGPEARKTGRVELLPKRMEKKRSALAT